MRAPIIKKSSVNEDDMAEDILDADGDIRPDFPTFADWPSSDASPRLHQQPIVAQQPTVQQYPTNSRS